MFNVCHLTETLGLKIQLQCSFTEIKHVMAPQRAQAKNSIASHRAHLIPNLRAIQRIALIRRKHHRTHTRGPNILRQSKHTTCNCKQRDDCERERGPFYGWPTGREEQEKMSCGGRISETRGLTRLDSQKWRIHPTSLLDSQECCLQE